MTQTEALKLALEALEEIALAGMSGTGQESGEGMIYWHSRQAWKFIGIAARALEPIKASLAQQSNEQDFDPNSELTDSEKNILENANTLLSSLKKQKQQSNEQVEPICWITPAGEGFRMRMTPPVNDVPLGWVPLFEHPPVPTAQPKELRGKPVAWAWFDEEDGRLSGALDYEQPPHYTVPLYTTPPHRKPLTDAQLEKGRGQTFSINNPFCPCDSKTFRKVARWVEAAHDIKE